MRTTGSGLGRLPHPPDLEVALVHIDVVHQHDPAFAHLGQPFLEVVGNRVVGVQAVNVQEIDAAVREILQRLIEGHAQETGEAAVGRLRVVSKIVVDVITIIASVLVAFPRVDRIACR